MSRRRTTLALGVQLRVNPLPGSVLMVVRGVPTAVPVFASLTFAASGLATAVLLLSGGVADHPAGLVTAMVATLLSAFALLLALAVGMVREHREDLRSTRSAWRDKRLRPWHLWKGVLFFLPALGMVSLGVLAARAWERFLVLTLYGTQLALLPEYRSFEAQSAAFAGASASFDGVALRADLEAAMLRASQMRASRDADVIASRRDSALAAVANAGADGEAAATVAIRALTPPPYNVEANCQAVRTKRRWWGKASARGMCANTTRPLVQWIIDWYTSAANKATAAVQKARAKSVGNTQAFVAETMQDALDARAEYARREVEAIPRVLAAARAAQWLGRLTLALGVLVGFVTFLVRILFDEKGPDLEFAIDRISRRPKEGGADITVGFDVYEELPLLSAQRTRELIPLQDWLYFPRGTNAAGLGARTVALRPLCMAVRRLVTRKVLMERWHTGASPLPPSGWRGALVLIAAWVLEVLRRWEIAAPAPSQRADNLDEGGENEPSLSVPFHQVVAIRTTSDRDITFAFSDLVGFTEGVRISTVYSVHAATSLLETGRFLLMARGDGMIALRAVGKVEGGDRRHRSEQMCALLAWDTRQRFQMAHEHGWLGSWFNPPSVKAIGSLGVVTHGAVRLKWYPLRRLLALGRYILLPL